MDALRRDSSNLPIKQDHHPYRHYSLTFSSDEISRRLNSVRFVLMTDCAHRADAQVEYLSKHLFTAEQNLPTYEIERLTGTKSRLALWKIGPVLVSDYGLGCASLSIALQELLLMCKKAEIIKEVTLIRFGTGSGIKVKPGTICIANKVFNSQLQDYVEQSVCSDIIRRQCVVDQHTAKSLYALALEHSSHEVVDRFNVMLGATVGAADYYEAQGRMSGAICDFNQDVKLEFLSKLASLGVVSIDLESHYMSAICHKLNVKFGIVSVALSDRLVDGGDEIKLTEDEVTRSEQRLFRLNLVFVRDLAAHIVAYPPKNETDVPPIGRLCVMPRPGQQNSKGQIKNIPDYDHDDGTCGGDLCVEPQYRSLRRRHDHG